MMLADPYRPCEHRVAKACSGCLSDRMPGYAEELESVLEAANAKLARVEALARKWNVKPGDMEGSRRYRDALREALADD